jgi:hypothetical protein
MPYFAVLSLENDKEHFLDCRAVNDSQWRKKGVIWIPAFPHDMRSACRSARGNDIRGAGNGIQRHRNDIIERENSEKKKNDKSAMKIP